MTSPDADQGPSAEWLREADLSLQSARSQAAAEPALVLAVVRQWLSMGEGADPREEHEALALPQVVDMDLARTVAVLLLSLGKAVCVKVFARMTPAEVRAIGVNMLRASVVSRSMQNEVVCRFIDHARRLVVLVDEPADLLHELLSASQGERHGDRLEASIHAGRGLGLAELLQRLSDAALAELLVRTPVAIASTILALLEAPRATAVARRLGPNVSLNILSAMAQSDPANAHALEDLHGGLTEMLSAPDWLQGPTDAPTVRALGIANSLFPAGMPPKWKEALGSGPP